MARGLKKHMKRLNAPKHWMLDKLGGAFVSALLLPFCCLEFVTLGSADLIALWLKYALTYREVIAILMQRHIMVDGKVRTDKTYPAASWYKLCKVRSVQFGQKGIPYLNTYDGRTIRYPDPLIKANDTIKLDLETNKIVDFIKFDVGNVVMDATGHEFATRMGNVFTIGKGPKPWVSLPKGKGIKLSIIEEARKRIEAQAATA
ncbi:unnamed protein product [Thlaspi arvense]|uniref:40S ribosomal protein S4 n=1 Tax=Thlaspi arvense TaxID=13288 RepID=A0AAU9RHK8_THLAR|nr:unnamed protein product [Thlaspi arvense]